MYTVGEWFVYLMNLAVIAIVGFIVVVVILRKRGQYQKEAIRCIQAEILLSTGHSEFYTVRCGFNDEWIKIKAFEYKLNPRIKRWGLHPRLPFMGLSSLQVTIRKETWWKDNPNPVYKDKTVPEITAAEVEAKTREAAAIAAGAEVVELEARQRQLVDAIANQPNKTVVYVLIGVAIIISGIVAVNSLL